MNDLPDISPQVGTELLFEDERVRVWSMALAPGEASPMHQHHHDHFYVYVTDENHMEVEYQDGRRVDVDVADGYVGGKTVGDGEDPDLIHRIRNVGQQPHRQIVVELLGAGATPKASAQ